MCDKVHYDALDERVTELESEVNQLRNETRGGFSSVNANIETLSQQITNMEARIIEEKQKWGDTLRGVTKWTVRAILLVVVYAAGINITKAVYPLIFK